MRDNGSQERMARDDAACTRGRRKLTSEWKPLPWMLLLKQMCAKLYTDSETH